MAKTDPLTGPPVTSVAEAVDRMAAIATVLDPGDGLAQFNRMYLQVTEAVQAAVGATTFVDPVFLARLDVVFANRYFDAVRAAATGARPPRAWNALLARRADKDLLAIQFALAGMNAHINLDLAVAVVLTCEELGGGPGTGSRHRDFQTVNGLLDQLEPKVRESFEGGAVLAVDKEVSPVADLLCNWTIAEARDVAWHHALHLWVIRSMTPLEDAYVDLLDRTTAVAGDALLVPLP